MADSNMDNTLAFFTEVATDRDLYEKIRNMEPAEIIDLARARGYEMSGEDLEATVSSITELAGPAGEMSLEELENVSGGVIPVIPFIRFSIKEIYSFIFGKDEDKT